MAADVLQLLYSNTGTLAVYSAVAGKLTPNSLLHVCLSGVKY